jgi:NAD(P)H-hydrate epimerase
MEKYSIDKKFVVMTREEVRAVDRWAIETLGVPGVVLMENAGRSCAELVKDKLKHISTPKICIFCGTGNNGGDGYVIARHLINSGFKVTIVLCGDRDKVKGDAKINLDILERLGEPIERLDLLGSYIPSQNVTLSEAKGLISSKKEIPRCARNDTLCSDVSDQVKNFAADADMIVDALFGTGLTGQLSDEFKSLIGSINVLDRSILSVDIPSGLDCDTGLPLGAAIKATYTVTFVAVKKGFVAASDASQYTGEIFIASIGVQPQKSICI